MKETKKQIVAQTINKVSAQYSGKLKAIQKQNDELKSKCSALYSENKSLKENLAEANEKIRQYEDWIQRLQPHWNELKREIKQALDDEIIKKYFDINKLEKLLLKYDNIDDVKKPYEFKMLITALVFYRFLIINNISSEERYTMIV